MEKKITCRQCGSDFIHFRPEGQRGRNPVFCPSCKEVKNEKKSKGFIASIKENLNL
jgi:hypothetical protein